MFQRLFGNTPEEQLTYLQPRILLTALVIVVGLLAMLFGGSGDWIIVIAAYVWGWNFLKNWFGFTTIGAFFSGNIAIGVVLFILMRIYRTVMEHMVSWQQIQTRKTEQNQKFLQRNQEIFLEYICRGIVRQ